jgi:uncharacterized membrane protein YbaN (DUF454 family)
MARPSPRLPRRRLRKAAQHGARPFLFALGWAFLVVGVAGIVLPLVPGTLFLILAAACFTRSSPRFEAWLLSHPVLGPPVRQWRETGSIHRGAKIFATVSLALSWALILWSDAPAFVDVLTAAILCAVAIYIVTRPER